MLDPISTAYYINEKLLTHLVAWSHKTLKAPASSCKLDLKECVFHFDATVSSTSTLISVICANVYGLLIKAWSSHTLPNTPLEGEALTTLEAMQCIISTNTKHLWLNGDGQDIIEEFLTAYSSLTEIMRHMQLQNSNFFFSPCTLSCKLSPRGK